MSMPLRQKMIEDMQLRGFAARTQEAYLLAVSQLARHYRKSPDQINEEELRQYFLFLKNDKHASRRVGLRQHLHHRPVRDQVFLPTHSGKGIENLRVGASAQGGETTGGAQYGRSAPDPDACPSPALPGLPACPPARTSGRCGVPGQGARFTPAGCQPRGCPRSGFQRT